MKPDLKALKSELERTILMLEGVNGIGTVLDDNDELIVEIAVSDETIREQVNQEIDRLSLPKDDIDIVIRPPMQF